MMLCIMAWALIGKSHGHQRWCLLNGLLITCAPEVVPLNGLLASNDFPAQVACFVGHGHIHT